MENNNNALYNRPNIRVYGWEYVKYNWNLPKGKGQPVFYGYADQNVTHRAHYDQTPDIEIKGALAAAVTVPKKKRG